MKKNYYPPKVVIHIVQCEECIAAYSASVTVGGPNGDASPYIEDWEVEDKGATFNL